MEHFRSTLVTTAVLITGLMTAAHVLHPRDAASEGRVGRPVVALEAATPWSDPPARPRPASMAEAPAPRPPTFTLLPVALTMRLSTAEAQQPLRHPRRAEAPRDHRMSERAVRARIAAVDQGGAASATRAARGDGKPSTTAKSDPIGDLLKALGLGQDSEG